MDDQKAIELYTRFREARCSLGHKYQIAAYHRFLDRGTYPVIAMPFIEIAKEQTREIANAVNEFGHYLHELTAWDSILRLLTEDEKFEVVFEFLLPTSVYCLGAPYAIKGRLHTSIAEVSHQANRFRLSTWKDDANLAKPNFKTAERHAQHWNSWPALAAALSQLSDDSFNSASDDFRNRFNHGYPRGVEFGLTGLVRRNVGSDGLVSYGLGSSPPLRIADLIPLLAQQHAAALDCYDTYINLVREQHAQLPAN